MRILLSCEEDKSPVLIEALSICFEVDESNENVGKMIIKADRIYISSVMPKFQYENQMEELLEKGYCNMRHRVFESIKMPLSVFKSNDLADQKANKE